jgi:hypothetical protein
MYITRILGLVSFLLLSEAALWPTHPLGTLLRHGPGYSGDTGEYALLNITHLARSSCFEALVISVHVCGQMVFCPHRGRLVLLRWPLSEFALRCLRHFRRRISAHGLWSEQGAPPADHCPDTSVSP